MTTFSTIRHTAQITGIAAISMAALGMTSCAPQSEKDFAAEHGFKRTDYWGTHQNRSYVPKGTDKQGVSAEVKPSTQ